MDLKVFWRLSSYAVLLCLPSSLHTIFSTSSRISSEVFGITSTSKTLLSIPVLAQVLRERDICFEKGTMLPSILRRSSLGMNKSSLLNHIVAVGR